MQYSFIIPTFNRYDLVTKAINSALKFINEDKNYEIIIIDDFSSDNTFELLNEDFKFEIKKKIIKNIKLDKNLGVVAARNIGANLASGDWLIFLDSDNEIIENNKIEFEKTLNATKSILVMFRCVDDKNNIIGPEKLKTELTYKSAINNDFCETLGVCKKSFFLEEYSKKDVVNLRRFESIAFYRLLKKYGPFHVSNLIMRKYLFESNDRLSSRTGVSKDANIFFKGYLILLSDHFKCMGFKKLLKSVAALFYYFILLLINILRINILFSKNYNFKFK